jgi:hypothetical protein
VQLGLQVEGTASHTGVTLLPPPTVEALLIDRRRHELVQSFKLAMLKLASQASTQQQEHEQQPQQQWLLLLYIALLCGCPGNGQVATQQQHHQQWLL